MFSNCMHCYIFFGENHQLETRIKDKLTPPEGQQLNEFCRLQTAPLIANPVRPSHRANTIALKVARTCPSSSRRSGKRAIFSALCSSFSQQTVSIPIANHRSLSAAVKSLRRCRGPLGCKLSVHWIPQHNLSLSRGMRKKTSSSWALLVISNMINVLEHHGMLEVGRLSLQVVHVSIGETGAHFQGCTAVSESQLFGQPCKVSADWRYIPPKLMLALPRLVGTQVRGKSNQD